MSHALDKTANILDLKRQANSHDAEATTAMFKLASFYGKSGNLGQASFWCRKAHKAGVGGALWKLGWIYIQHKNFRQGFFWLELAADKRDYKNAHAILNSFYGCQRFECAPTVRNGEDALYWIKQVYERDPGEIQRMENHFPLCDFLLDGARRKVPQSEAFLKELAAKGMIAAMRNCYRLYVLMAAKSADAYQAISYLRQIFGKKPALIENIKERWDICGFLLDASEENITGAYELLANAGYNGCFTATYLLFLLYSGAYKNTHPTTQEDIKQALIFLKFLKENDPDIFKKDPVFYDFLKYAVQMNVTQAQSFFEEASKEVDGADYFEKGTNILHNHLISEAVEPKMLLPQLMEDALTDDKKAQYKLGLIYEKGDGVAQDPVTANYWYHKAAKHGYSDAYIALGRMAKKRGEEQQAIEFYQQAAALGDDQAYYYLSEIYGERSQFSQAQDYLKKSADNGNSQAQYKLGEIFFHQEDYNKAQQYWHQAAESGSIKAQLKLAEQYFINWEDDKAAFWYRRLAYQENERGYAGLGDIYARKGDVFKAIYWHKKAAIKGDVKAQYNLGNDYEKLGWQSRAILWWQRAARTGYIAANNALAHATYFGLGVERNISKAIDFYNKAGATGDGQALLGSQLARFKKQLNKIKSIVLIRSDINVHSVKNDQQTVLLAPKKNL